MNPDTSPLARLKTGCKINLFLRVGNRLDNGYHAIESFFLPLEEPHDELLFFPRAKGTRVSFFLADDPGKSLPDIDPATNTITRALSWYAEQTGFAPALNIRVHKGVPRGAGLGGGSANAAALLFFLQEECATAGHTPLPESDLIRCSAAVGADVPFFLLNQPAMVAGVGERLHPAPPPFPGHFLLLACPPLQVSTAWAFAALDERRAQACAAPEKNFPETLTSRDPRAIKPLAQAPQEFVNDFEDVVFSRFPELRVPHERMLRSGAVLARMSGTGAAVFGVFREKRNAEDCAKTLANDNVSVYIQHLPVV